jgi:ribosome-binding protein aMBF1 (putative translation factor)
MEHQDWSPVIFKKKPEKISIPDSPQTISSTSSKPAWKIEKMIDEGIQLLKVSKEDSKIIIAGRINMKLSQKDLATRLNMQIKDIQEIENGKAIENKQVLSKIKKFLNVK